MRQTRVLAPFTGVSVRDSGAGDGSYTINGHAAVFNEWSLPLGWSGFREQVAPGAFARVLGENPHVISNWLHDDRWQLGTTLNNTLTLREDGETGLEYWTRVAPTSYAADLRLLLERGDVTQCSFCFTIERESWTKEEPEEGPVQFFSTIEEVGQLFDVCVCPMGAYPQTDLALVANNLASGRDRLEEALREGRVPDATLDEALERGWLPARAPRSAPDTAPAGTGVAPTAQPEGVTREFLAHERAHVDRARSMIPR